MKQINKVEKIDKIREMKDLKKDYDYYLKLKEKYSDIKMKLVLHINKLDFDHMVSYEANTVNTIENLFKILNKYLNTDTENQVYKEIKSIEDYKKTKINLYNQINNFDAHTFQEDKNLNSILKYLKEKNSRTK